MIPPALDHATLSELYTDLGLRLRRVEEAVKKAQETAEDALYLVKEVRGH